ncbi:MAG TPA: hypothetical protein PKN56_07110, partial [Leptospiraceae bacterium]|nr:hypothetical protein [Leptospiraceae bacterium]HNN03310.1 hypothetical protein [Leptospiraceae bacterium]
KIISRGLLQGISMAVGFLTCTLLAVSVTGTFNTFSSGTLLKSADINANFATLKTAIETVDSKIPESFCTTVANGATTNNISCPTGKKFFGAVVGGRTGWINVDTACPTSYGGALPTPNVRIDDDADATPNSVLFITFGCNGLNSCSINSNTLGLSYYLGSCY